MPRCSLCLLFFEPVAGLAITLVALVEGFLASGWLSLNMERTYGGLELWRLASAPVLPDSVFQGIVFSMMGWSFSFMLERAVGWGAFLGLLFFAVACVSLLTSGLTALIALTPGMRDVPYFASQWTSDVNMGPGPLLVFLAIMGIRLSGQKTFTCCFRCPVPAWGVILLTVLVAQLMLYPPWEGVPYTLSGVAAAYILPRRAFKRPPSPEAEALVAAEGESADARPAEAPPPPVEEFRGRGRSL